jgi:hypothetical protein
MADNQKLTGQVSLTRLTHVIMEKKGKTGMVKGLFIPIDVNALETVEYTDKDGKKITEIVIPVSLVIKPETDARGQDGFIGKNIPTEMYKKATDAEKEEFKKITPILGNLKDWGRGGGSSAPKQADAGGGEVFNADSDDDLPF